MPTLALALTADGFYRLTAGSTEYLRLLSDDGDTSVIQSQATARAWTFLCEAAPGATLSVQAVRIGIKFALTGTTNAYGPAPMFRYAGVDAVGTPTDDQIASAGYRVWWYTVAPTGGWTPAIVNQTEFGFMMSGDTATGVFKVTLLIVEIDYEGAPARIESAREVGARILRLGRRPPESADLDARLRFAHVGLGQILAVSHPEGPSPTPNGWGEEVWERAPIMITSAALDLNNYRASLRGIDVRQHAYLCSLWRSMRTKMAFDASHQGAIKLDSGAGTEFLRDSPAWTQNPPDSQWRRAEKNVERIGLEGGRFEPERVNAMPYSSFDAGYGVGYSVTSGSGTVTNDTARLLFDPTYVHNCLKIVSGNPHSSATLVQGTATAAGYYAANAKIVVSVWHEEDYAGDLAAARIQRTVDGWYWNKGTKGPGAWQSSPFDNVMPSTLFATEPWTSGVINVGAAATGIRVTYVVPAGVTGGKTVRVFHGQIEAGEWASSPIVTYGTDPVTRKEDTLRVYTTGRPHVWHLEAGTAWLDLISDWSSADLTATRTLLKVAHGGGDSDALTYNASAGEARFIKVVGGVPYRAKRALVVTRGTKYRFVVRWCGRRGEWGLAPYTVSIWAGPVAGNAWTRGTDATPPRLPVPLATRSLYIGGQAGQQVGGLLSNLDVTPLVLPDWMIEDL